MIKRKLIKLNQNSGVRTKWAKKSRAKRQSNGPKLVKCLNESSFS